MPFFTQRQLKIIKRDGRQVDFDREKILKAISKAMLETKCFDKIELERLTDLVVLDIIKKFSDSGNSSPNVSTVEDIQDMVENILMANNPELAKNYILYRAERTRIRERNSDLMKTFNELTNLAQTDIQRENANIDCNTAMGTMLKYGSESAKYFYESCVISEDQRKAHHEGDIHIHDFDFYTLTTTCCQIDLIKLFKNGFSTGHGFLREPNSIRSYAALACIAIQANQNDQHGGQSVPNFDYAMADGVKKTFRHV